MRRLQRHLAQRFASSTTAQRSPCHYVEAALAQLQADPTPVVPIGTATAPRIYAKLEGHNPSGSVKDRAIPSIVADYIQRGVLHPQHGTLVLVTSGSAGVALTHLHSMLTENPALYFTVVVVIPDAYRHRTAPANIIASDDTYTIENLDLLMDNMDIAPESAQGSQFVVLEDAIFLDCLAKAKALCEEHGWTLLDQHYEKSGAIAHKSTANEIMDQVPGVTDVVACTGTGATAAGLREFLPASVRVHSRAAPPGAIDGLTDVRRYDNFCDTTELEGYEGDSFDPEVAAEHLEELEVEHGIQATLSSGAALWLAREVCDEDPDSKVVFIAADGQIRDDHASSAMHILPTHPSIPKVPSTLRSTAATVRTRPSASQAAIHTAAAAAATGTDAAQVSTSPSLSCFGCGATFQGDKEPVFACPNHATQPGIDHVLAPATPPLATPVIPSDAAAELLATPNPFLRYRSLMFSYHVALARGMADAEYVDMVSKFDDRIAEVDGSGFVETPLHWNAHLRAFIKDETANVAQSHKARHLANVMLYLLAMRATGHDDLAHRRLAVASCGNAGLAAAVIAAAAGWPIDVCIPPEASPVVVHRLHELGADVHICARDGNDVVTPLGRMPTTQAADPTLSVCRALVHEHGSIPFSVQGSECGIAVEGGRTLGFEILTALGRDFPIVEGIDNVFVQVGGGALAAGLMQGLEHGILRHSLSCIPGHPAVVSSIPRLFPVQPSGNTPLARAFTQLQADGCTAKQAARDRQRYMQPSTDPSSIATGLLDDETYEWVALCDAMLRFGGSPVVVDDDTISEAHGLLQTDCAVPVCHTGAVSLAGLMSVRQNQTRDDAADHGIDLVIATGRQRDP